MEKPDLGFYKIRIFGQEFPENTIEKTPVKFVDQESVIILKKLDWKRDRKLL